MSNKQKGLGALVVLVVVVVAVAGFAAWQVYMSGHKSDVNKQTAPTQHKAATITPAPVVPTKGLTDSSGTFSFKYPENWTIQKYVYSTCCEGEAAPEPDWTKTPQPIKLTLPNMHVGATVSVSGDNTGALTIEKAQKERTADKFNTFEKLKINGYDALYNKTDFTGPANVEAYIDHYYLVQNGKNSVEFKFRQKYRHDWNNKDDGGKTNFDASAYLAAFKQLVSSVTFNTI